MATNPEKVALDAPKTSDYKTPGALIKALLLTESVDILKTRFENNQIADALVEIMWDIVELYLSCHEEDVAGLIPHYKLPTTPDSPISLNNLIATAKKHNSVTQTIINYTLVIRDFPEKNRIITDEEIEEHFEFYKVNKKYYHTLLNKVRDELSHHPRGRMIFPTLPLYQRTDPDIMVRFLMSLVRTGKTDEAIYSFLQELKIHCDPSCLAEARRNLIPSGSVLNQLIMPTLPFPPEAPPDYELQDSRQSFAQSPHPRQSLDAYKLATLEVEIRSLRDLVQSQAIASSSSSACFPASPSQLASPLRFSHPATPPGDNQILISNNRARDFADFILGNSEHYSPLIRHNTGESQSELNSRIEMFANAYLARTLLPSTATIVELRALELLEAQWKRVLETTITDTYDIISQSRHYFPLFQKTNEFGEFEAVEKTQLSLLSLIKTCVEKTPLPVNILPDSPEVTTILRVINEISISRRASFTQTF
jgi:hypothetical protein